MDNDILSFLDEIKEQTSVEFSVYTPLGECVYGKKIDGEITLKKGQYVFLDHSQKNTQFAFRLKNKDFIGVIEGDSEIQSNYATFIIKLCNKTSFKAQKGNKDEFFSSLILGELTYEQVREGAKAYGLTDKECCAMIIKYPSGAFEDVKVILTDYSESKKDFFVKISDDKCAYVKFTDSVVSDYHSYPEFANFLAKSVMQEVGLNIHLSLGEPVKAVADIPLSYSQAVSTQRMVEEEDVKESVHAFKEYVLVKMLEDMPRHKLNEYAELLTSKEVKEIFLDKEIIETAEVFLSNSLNVSETARELYIHRNTLAYRLDKIEKITGLNIRKFSDAVTFRLITLLFKMIR